MASDGSTTGVASDPNDGRYWPMVFGQPFDPRNVDERERLMREAVQVVFRSFVPPVSWQPEEVEI